jgi:hypothetical protein
MKKLFMALALATAMATPAFAATGHHNSAPSTHRLYMYAPEGLDNARNAAMQECNALAEKWSNSSWETTQLATYGSCMAQHGQRP